MRAKSRRQTPREPRGRPRHILVRTFVWIVLAIFVLTSVGVALVNFTQ